MNVQGKKHNKSKISSRLLAYIYTCVLCIYEYIYAEIQSIWILRALQVSRLVPWAHVMCPMCVCVCVCSYTY